MRDSTRLVAVGILLFVGPFVAYTRYHDYSLLAPEILICLAFLLGIGLCLGLAMGYGGTFVRAFTAAGSVILYLDLQTNWFDPLGQVVGGKHWIFLFVFVLVGGIFYLIRKWLDRMLFVILLPLFVAAFFVPSQAARTVENERRTAAGPSSKLPPVLHIVLDEHIGIEGFPTDIVGAQETADAVKQFFLKRGFRVSGKAFSRHARTQRSLSDLFNRSGHRQPEFTIDDGRNEYFRRMKARGYEIEAMQTEEVDLCPSALESRPQRCITYEQNSIVCIRDISIPMADKVAVIASHYSIESYLLIRLKRHLFSNWLGTTTGLVSPICTMNMLKTEAFSLRAGTLTVIHLLLPHFPYIYDRNCRIRPRAEWLDASNEEVWPGMNSPDSRRERYSMYFDQVMCTQKMLAQLFTRFESMDHYQDAIVIVHGDHGSRIALTRARVQFQGKMTPEDFVDAFSTLFAVRVPGSPAVYDRRLLPIDALFAEVMSATDASSQLPLDFKPTVYLQGKLGQSVVELPDFGENKVGGD